MSFTTTATTNGDSLEHNDHWQAYAQLQVQAANLVRNAFSDKQRLLSRIESLEAELQVWKLGHSAAVKDKDSAQKLVREYEGGSDAIIVCLLDGDGAIFDRSYIARGREGGREAAQALMKHVTDMADSSIVDVHKSTKVICNVWFNKTGLGRVLQENGIAQESTFTAFVQGFNAAHPLFTMTDVGAQKEAADAKFRESLRFFTKLPSCKLVLAACAHDGGYSHALQSLETEGSISKVRVLKSFDESAFEIKRLHLQMAEFPGLFESKKLSSTSYTHSTPLAPSTIKKITSSSTNGSSSSSSIAAIAAAAAAAAAGVTPKKLFNPASSSSLSATPKANPSSSTPTTSLSKTLASASSSNSRVKADKEIKADKETKTDKETKIHKETKETKVLKENNEDGFTKVVKRPALDPSKPLHKQNPPPCNIFYLKGECSRDNCPYEHQYRLTPKQVTLLRLDAKKSPCYDMLKGRKCSPDCIAGHRCPFDKCPFGGREGSCRFKAPGMHGEDQWISTDDDSD
ncbi:hypothetical protein OIO90_003352 [Microbotryomycetes sp. JL221]|nr:hypothetical protein OIO90_003352 [Microbotryomycetes sp. JL221]